MLMRRDAVLSLCGLGGEDDHDVRYAASASSSQQAEGGEAEPPPSSPHHASEAAEDDEEPRRRRVVWLERPSNRVRFGLMRELAHRWVLDATGTVHMTVTCWW